MRTRTLRSLLPMTFCVAVAACGPENTATNEDETETVSNLNSAQRRARSEAVKAAAAEVGLTNALLLAGIADVETNLAHCWSEATWACQGPASADCGGGAIIAGSADGACWQRLGGLSMFQFDGGNHDQTLAREGTRILSIRGSTHAAIDFAVNMILRSDFISGITTREQAISHMNNVRVGGTTWHSWIQTVTAYYNGCYPGRCSVYAERYARYDNGTRNLLNEMGNDFWYSSTPQPQPGRVWTLPMASTTWQIDFNITNPWVGGQSSCFGVPLNRLVHAGEDWAQSAGTPVVAIGEGRVVYSANANYPGHVVVIEHTLTQEERTRAGLSTSTIYSMYGHLNAPSVSAGQMVVAGQQIATILNQASNSHLHWEVRVNDRPPLCAYSHPGPGYTGPSTDARNWGYLDPANMVALLSSAPARTTCDNGVAVGSTACAFEGDANEYVCARPTASSSEQWDLRACSAGGSCRGDRCQNPQPQRPSAPTNLLPGYTTITVPYVNTSWNAVAGATSYDLLMQTWDPVGLKFDHYYQWNGLNTTNLQVWPQYDYRHYGWWVRACNAQGCSDWSSMQQFFFDGL
jgi:hypothetical protein